MNKKWFFIWCLWITLYVFTILIPYNDLLTKNKVIIYPETHLNSLIVEFENFLKLRKMF